MNFNLPNNYIVVLPRRPRLATLYLVTAPDWKRYLVFFFFFLDKTIIIIIIITEKIIIIITEKNYYYYYYYYYLINDNWFNEPFAVSQ